MNTRFPANPDRLTPRDHVFRAGAVAALAALGAKPQEAAHRLGYAARAAAAPGATSGTWAGELTTTTTIDFLDDLSVLAAGPAILARALSVETGRHLAVHVPAASGAAAHWVAENEPIPGTAPTVTAAALNPRKLALLIGLSREAISVPTVEAATRAAIREAAAAALDQAMLDAAALDDARPAGLLNGLAPLPAAPGDDHVAMRNDLGALAAAVAPVAAGGMFYVCSPDRAIRIAFAAPALADRVLSSAQVPAGRVIAIAPSAVAAGLGEMSIAAALESVIHMEDTSPAEIVSAVGPTTAAPARSYFQTDAIIMRMTMTCAWARRSPQAVAYVESAGL